MSLFPRDQTVVLVEQATATVIIAGEIHPYHIRTCKHNTIDYDPVDASRREIRLLVLKPAPNFEDNINCELRKVSLYDKPEYASLSYAWGDPSVTSQIFVHGHPFMATTSLVSALRHLRLRDAALILWVDAISINQRDLRERSQQVGFMAEIYRSAVYDLLWLGPENEEISRALAIFDDSYMHAFFMKPGTISVSEAWSILLRNAPVWGRIWVVQELVFAKDIWIICGHKTVRWQNKWYTTETGFKDDIKQEIDGLRSRTPTDLFSLWRQLRHFHCTDPRDRLFAIMGMAKDIGVVPDYETQVKEVFGRIARQIILKHRTLDLLNYCRSKQLVKFASLSRTDTEFLEALPAALRHRWTDPDRCSWIPDFVNQEKLENDRLPGTRWHTNPDTGKRRWTDPILEISHPNSKLSSHCPQWVFSEDCLENLGANPNSSELRLNGIIIDRVGSIRRSSQPFPKYTLVSFNEFGHILKVSLLIDFSIALIIGLGLGTACEAVVDILRNLSFDLNVDCVRMLRQTTSSEVKATAKVEDTLFARELSSKLKSQRSTISAVPVPINSRGTSCSKAHISWHKATRSVWVNFGNGEIANRIARKFNEGKHKCLGQSVKSSIGRKSPSRGFSHNLVAWTITLSDVPSDATSENIKAAITLLHDKPRHVEISAVSYRVSDAEVSVEVRSLLEDHGLLESFYLATTSKGKRVKATAWFQDEVDARSACSLNNRPLDILNKGKLTVTLLQSVKIKVFTNVYFALKSMIDEKNKTWKEQHLAFHVYTDTMQRFTTLKIEGDNTKNVANARKKLDTIVNKVVLTDDNKQVLWDSAFSSNGTTYKKLKSIEETLHVVIIRDKSRRQLQVYGSLEKLKHVCSRIIDITREASSTSYEIDLRPNQFSWTIRGGFRNIEQALGNDIAVFNVVSKKITINGTQQQYETALALLDGKRAVEARSLSDSASSLKACPICFCEAENPIQTSCKHTYCLECFEGFCKSAGSTSKEKFQIKCEGDQGTCTTVFSLSELKDHLSSSIFEVVLKSSFEEYIQRHPDAFRYCPTPDCGYIYRCITSPSKKAAHTCPNCFEPICTSCHAIHGDYTCAQYKDGYEALKKLKKELNIKDCPRCTTPMEKTEVCNHMTCGGCKAHICWVCMKVFEMARPCYDHMNREHGGIGLGLEHFMD
ncbi:hypothetical protein B7463_g8590, partial [Scytalidium lignicola]